MAITNNDVLGYRDCTTCGKRGSVHKAKGRRNQLYQRNCDCGCVQSNGQLMQSKLWYETTWLGEPPAKPANVMEKQAYQDALGKESKRLQGMGEKPGQEVGQIDRQTKETQGLQPDENSGQASGQLTDFDPTVDREVNQEVKATNPVKRPIGLWWLVAAAGLLTAIVAG